MTRRNTSMIKVLMTIGAVVLSIILYGVGYSDKVVASPFDLIAIKVADVLLIGVIWGLVVDAAKIMGVFKNELQAIVDCEDYLKRRTDIERIWDNATKALFKNRFPLIQKDLFGVVKKYMSGEKKGYYSRYNINTQIQWLRRDDGIIRVTDTVEFKLVADKDEELIHPIKSWTVVRDERDYRCEMTRLEVNNRNILGQITPTQNEEENNVVCKQWRLPLHGSSSYRIRYTRETDYNIHDDYFVSVKAEYITKDMTVDLTLQEGLEATFMSRGTQAEFTSVINERRHIKMEYEGIILPHQGYIFALRT